ncbi:tetratricopeptide repeat protein [Actinomadura madurae]|uniref:tetratricopeptide repeat protein n=1 Tax=Actinomadura madurae TaxID=1993 RepID=UPI0020D26173|nr:tetratricopeptide repeat protein [Actinomadura madurae]MCP9985191.1 tetratricopeptide repeat protein [Actinomadura madurae]
MGAADRRSLGLLRRPRARGLPRRGRGAAALPPGDAVAEYEIASAHDSIGNEAEAAVHYRRAFEAGLAGTRRREGTIQYASTLRNLGRAEESIALLTTERDAVSDDLDDAVTAFLALALTDVGRERGGIARLGRPLPPPPRYNRSLAAYAEALTQESPAD